MATEEIKADTFPKLLLHHSRQRGERPAIREKNRGIWRTMTWRDLADEAIALAAALSARGLKRGDHVALIGDNRPRLYAAMCAAQSLGAIAVPLYQDAAADELVAPIQSAKITHVFAENQEQVDKLLEILPRCPTIRCIVYDKDRGMRHYKQPQVVSYAALLQQSRQLTTSNDRDDLHAEIARGNGQDTAFLFFTSGTTGPAKGVVLTYASLIDRARAVAAAEGLTDADVAIAYLPPGWIGQNFFGYVLPMVIGYCTCCPESSDTMLADMREVAPTCFLATPRVLEALLTEVAIRIEDTGGFNQRLFRYCMAIARRAHTRQQIGKGVSIAGRLALSAGNLLIYGPLRDVLGMSKARVAIAAGDAVSPDLLAFFRALGVNLKSLYGSTETGFFVAMQRDGRSKPDSVGSAIDGVELKISPQHEILVRSPGLFKEYHNDPTRTTQAKTGDGWFKTGDAGYLDDDGHLRVIDRMEYVGTLKNNAPYAPKQLENRLKIFPYVKEAVAFGDGRDTVCMLVDIDTTAVGRWADKQSISYTGHADLASLGDVYDLIGDCIAKVNAAIEREPELAKSGIRRFAILQTGLSADDGMLTRVGTLRRGALAERYRPIIDAIYAGQAQVDFKFDEGGAVQVKIREPKISTRARVRKAA